jgi:hypothetical protein
MTIDGIAETALTLEHAGILEIRATSDPAQNSLSLQVINQGETTEILTPTPTPTPTSTPTPTPTPTLTPTSTPTPTPTPTPSPTPLAQELPPPEPMPRVQWFDLLSALLGMIAASGVVVVVGGGLQMKARVVNPLARAALLSGVFGLAGYIYYGLGFPGSSIIDRIVPGFRGLFVGFGWGLVPLLLLFLLVYIKERYR